MATQPEMTAASDSEPTGHITRGQAAPAALLPAWESFAALDRRRLVRTLLQAAQQHVTLTQTGHTRACGR